MLYGFIILRHVRCNKTNNYWIECYDCIRNFYPLNSILIIDDNSNYSFITEKEITNTIIINSEFKGRGELLPYYYYLQNKFVDKVIILHDSVFIQNYINFDIYNNIFLWEFEHYWDDKKKELEIISKLDNYKIIYNYYNKKKLWKGCFGAMSVISYDLLKSINDKYNISKLLNYITCRNERSNFERIIAVLITNETKNNINKTSIFGNIKTFCKWEYTYEEYINDKNKHSKDLIVKVWTGR
jgi:hypothetical protein